MLARPLRGVLWSIALVALPAFASAQLELARHASPLGLGGTGYGNELLLDGQDLFVAESRPTGGVVHFYTYAGANWSLVQTFSGSAATPADEFGFGLDIDGDTLIVGAPGDRARGLRAGAAYVFRRVGGFWLEEARLVPAGLETNDFFGRHVGVVGTRALVSAGGDDDQGAQSGAAYAFERSAGAWSLTQKLFASDPHMTAFFGDSLAMDGDLALFGAGQHSAGGAAYVFEYSGGSWVERQRILNAGPGAYFGFRLDMQGTRLAIGALFGLTGTVLAGRVYLFDLSGSSWVLDGHVEPPDPYLNDRFSRALDLAGDRLIVGAPDHPAVSTSSTDGAAYLYERVQGQWQFVAKLTASDQSREDNFGHAVQLQGELALVGSIAAPGGPANQGAAYVFEWPVGTRAYCHCPTSVAPCGNADPLAGCGFGGRGARLSAGGTGGVLADDLVLRAVNVPPGATTLLFMGDQPTLTVLGDGLRCVGASPGGGLFRFALAASSADGMLDFGPGLAAASAALPALGQITAGASWNFQAFFRTPTSTCGAGANLTNAIAVAFVP